MRWSHGRKAEDDDENEDDKLMSHLMKDADGHLIARTDGHLARCTECHDCEPPIPCWLKVVISGFGGYFASINGTWALHWHPSIYDHCGWIYQETGTPFDYIHLRWCIPEGESTYKWAIFIPWPEGGMNPANCAVSIELDNGDGCDPCGTYALVGCEDVDCNTPGGCDDSVGASAVVSYY